MELTTSHTNCLGLLPSTTEFCRVEVSSKYVNEEMFTVTLCLNLLSGPFELSSIDISKRTLGTITIISQYLKAIGSALKMEFARMI